MPTFNPHQTLVQLLRRPALEQLTGKSKSALYRDIDDGLLTEPVRIGSQSVGWPSNEIAAINAARIAGKSDDHIRALVARLMAARKEAA